MADRERRAYAWLNRLEWGWSTDKVARYARVSPRLVQKELARLEREIEAATAIRFHLPKLVLFCPLNGLFPTSRCRCTPSNQAVPRGGV